MSTEHSKTGLHIWLHVHSALLGIIFISALVLNSLLIFVLHKMKSRRSNRDRASYNIERSYMYLLFHLAFADMLGVVLNITFDILNNAGLVFYFSNAGCQVLPPFQLASTTAQAGTYVALSYHRFRAIVTPIRAKLTVYRSLIWIAIIWVISISLSIPFVIVHRFDGVGGCEERWGRPDAGNIYTFAIFVVQYAGPVTLMAAFYLKIARALHEHRIQKELVHVPTQDDVRSHRHIVKMLVTIVTVYGVCMLPHNVFWIAIGYTQDIDVTLFNTISSVSYLFTYSNSVANPVVFYFYNKESRYHLKRFFKQLCCCFTRNMDVPFEIKKWSATWSGHSKSDSHHPQETKQSKNQLKLDQLFLAKPGDSDLGVSLPWEAHVFHSQCDSDEDHKDYPSSPPLPQLSLSPGDHLESPNDTTNPFIYYGVPRGTKRYPSDTTLDITHENEEHNACVVDVNGGCDKGIVHEESAGCGSVICDNGDGVPAGDVQGIEKEGGSDKQDGSTESIEERDSGIVEEGQSENAEGGTSESEGCGEVSENEEGAVSELKDNEEEGEISESEEGESSEIEEEGLSEIEEGVSENEDEDVYHIPPWDEGVTEDYTARVQNMIERMMQDIRHEMKAQDGGMNGMKRLEDILNLNDSSSNSDWGAGSNGEGLNGSLTHLGTSAQDLVKDMAGFMAGNRESEQDLKVLRERLNNLPETRM